jgi:hypothetical protein
VVDSGRVLEHAGAAPATSAPSPVREGQPMLVHLAGTPGELAFLLAAPSPSGSFLSPFASVLLAASPFAVVAAGAYPPGGTVQLAATPGDLGAGVEGALAVLQSAACSLAPLACTLGSASAVLLLDAGL